MFKIEYFHKDTGETDWFYKTLKKDALKMLDKFIDNGPDQVKSVSAYKVAFKNGDYARVVDLVPLSALMLERSPAVAGESDSIFDD